MSRIIDVLALRPSNLAIIANLRSSMSGGRTPFSAHRSRSWAYAKEWNVPVVMLSRNPKPRSRVRSSLAALRVNVTDKVRWGSIAPVATRCAIRRVSTRVLPLPAPARMASGLWADDTAANWVGSRPSRRASVFSDESDMMALTLPSWCDKLGSPTLEINPGGRDRDTGTPLRAACERSH